MGGSVLSSINKLLLAIPPDVLPTLLASWRQEPQFSLFSVVTNARDGFGHSPSPRRNDTSAEHFTHYMYEIAIFEMLTCNFWVVLDTPSLGPDSAFSHEKLEALSRVLGRGHGLQSGSRNALGNAVSVIDRVLRENKKGEKSWKKLLLDAKGKIEAAVVEP